MMKLGYKAGWILMTVILLSGLYPVVPHAGNAILKGATTADPDAVQSVNKPQFDTQERAWLQAHKKVTVATSQYPPLTFMDESGSMAGISADYLRLISERTGLTFEVKPLAWPIIMEQAKSREIDLFSGLKNPDRDKYLNFTSPYLDVSYVVINRVSGPYLRNFSNLNGQKVAVVKNWAVHKLLKNKFPNVVVVPFGSLKKALIAVSTSRVEAYVGDMLTASFQIQETLLTNLKVAAPAPFQEDFVRFAVRKDWPELVTIMEKVIQSISRERREAILDKWLQVNFEKSVDWTLVWIWAGAVAGVLGLIIILIGFWNHRLQREIRNRKQTETALLESEASMKQAKEEAEAASRAKTEFLSSMSHELRTPLHAVLGFAQVLGLESRDPLTKRQRNAVDHILRGGRHLLELINDVLELNKIESRELSLNIEDIPARDVIDVSLSLIQMRADRDGIKIIDQTSGSDLPLLFTDKTRLKQALLNLLSNAVKYNGKGGTVTLSCHQTPDQLLRISVADTGRGIPIEKQADLFKPFDRLGSEGGAIEGTGIGLTITKQIIELLDGQVGFETVQGEGSTFWIDVPLSRKQVPVQNKSRQVRATERGSNQENGEDAVSTILYVEDNPDNMRLMESIIGELENIRLLTAFNAELGIDLATSEKPDLILMDINLPGINGIEALKRMQNIQETKDIPVIAITADAMTEDIEAGMKAGFREYITKPINVSNLIRTIEENFAQVNSTD